MKHYYLKVVEFNVKF